jgi:serine/threonine-protein kinase
MSEVSAEQFAQRVINANLLDERQLESIWSELGSREESNEKFRLIALRRQLLTNYQVEKLLRGDRSGFYYGDYKTLYLVGSGTFARVYRAVHRDTGEVKALKVLRTRYSRDPDETQNFLREGRMGKILQHPNIVPIHEVQSIGKSHYIVMDFVEGRNLREFVKIRKKLDAGEATDIAIQMVEGLNYAFIRGISHRDMKLSNVLISSHGVAQLVDFGLAAATGKSAKGVEEHPNPRAIDYAGLERVTGVRKDDKRSDIYFLGCMYYNMLTGEPPLHETKHRVQRLSVSRFRDVVPINQIDPELPQPLVMIVKRAMQLNPNSRYQTPAEMYENLKLARKGLESGVALTAHQHPEGAPAATRRTSVMARSSVPTPVHALMVVESDVEMQDLLRARLKKRGYRVLVTNDPTRAIGRFETSEQEKPAECVIFSTRELGERSVKAFNLFGKLRSTRRVPAILLLEEGHGKWRQDAEVAAHRVVVQMPIRLGQLQAVFEKLLDSAQSR